MFAVAGGAMFVRPWREAGGVPFDATDLRLLPEDEEEFGVLGALGAAPYFANSSCVELYLVAFLNFSIAESFCLFSSSK